jgi:hypothetical protein
LGQFLLGFNFHRKDNPSEKQEIGCAWRKETKHNNNCPKGLGLFLFGLSPKRNKKNTHCALCVLSEAGGESIFKGRYK